MLIGKKSSNVQESIITDDNSSESIEATFSTFVDDMYDVLEQEKFDKIQRKSLENINIEHAKTKIRGGIQMSKVEEQEIAGTRNVAELFKVICSCDSLRPYWNWMNIRILEKLAGNCEPAKCLIEKYKKDICSRKVKDVISEISSLETPMDYTEVTVKFKKDFNDLLVGDIVQGWREIEKKLGVEETMLLKSITKGCVEICWLLRNDLVDHAIHSATSGYLVSQSATQEQVEGDRQLVIPDPPKYDSQSTTQEFAEVLYLKIGEVIIKDDTTVRFKYCVMFGFRMKALASYIANHIKPYVAC